MKSIIDQFTSDKAVALVGASREEHKWGNALMKELTGMGITVHPVHRELDHIQGRRCVSKASQLPKNVKGLIVATRPDDSEQIVRDAAEAGIERIWFQRGMGKGSASPEALSLCKETGIDAVHGVCPMMFYGEKPGFHGVHFKLRRLFGGLPQEWRD